MSVNKINKAKRGNFITQMQLLAKRQERDAEHKALMKRIGRDDKPPPKVIVPSESGLRLNRRFASINGDAIAAGRKAREE